MGVPSRKAYTNIGVKFFPYYDLLHILVKT